MVPHGRLSVWLTFCLSDSDDSKLNADRTDRAVLPVAVAAGQVSEPGYKSAGCGGGSLGAGHKVKSYYVRTCIARV
jgi:hypothetical protein